MYEEYLNELLEEYLITSNIKLSCIYCCSTKVVLVSAIQHKWPEGIYFIVPFFFQGVEVNLNCLNKKRRNKPRK